MSTRRIRVDIWRDGPFFEIHPHSRKIRARLNKHFKEWGLERLCGILDPPDVIAYINNNHKPAVYVQQEWAVADVEECLYSDPKTGHWDWRPSKTVLMELGLLEVFLKLMLGSNDDTKLGR
jgi:hypothetical protein